MSGEIFRVKQHTGQRGRPREIEVRGAKKTDRDKEPEILGAAVSGEPTIIDRTSQIENTAEVEVRQHSVEIHEGEGQIRQHLPKPGEPQVRVVTTDRVQWDKVKRGEDDGV